MYGILILTGGDWTDHVHKLELNLNKLKESGLKFNTENYSYRKTEKEDLSLWVICDVVKPEIKNRSNKKYDANNFSKRITSVYRFSELL